MTKPMPSHYHDFWLPLLSNEGRTDCGEGNYWWRPTGRETSTKYIGGNTAHNNLPPYLSVYMWKRTS